MFLYVGGFQTIPNIQRQKKKTIKNNIIIANIDREREKEAF